MKKTLFISTYLILSLISLTNLAQTQTGGLVTPGGLFETVFDKEGKQISVSDLAIRLNQSNNQIYVASSNTCSAGLFNIYYDNNSGMAGTSTLSLARRATICELCENVSALIGWNSTWPTSVTVNLLVDDISSHTSSASSSTVLALGTSIYACPLNPSSPNPGIEQNLIQRTVISKQDAWNGITNPLNVIGGGFYHGFLSFNFANTTYTWNSVHTTTVNGQYDLYAVALHELMHAMGFASLISSTGVSIFGAVNNYYSTYDKNLFRAAATPTTPFLSSAASASCNQQYGLTFANPSATVDLQPGCPGSYTTDVTVCSVACKYHSINVSNMPVYTPGCFNGGGGSLSHFEDMCPTATLNNQYFVMSNAANSGQLKRYLQDEERKVLCDLGYSVIATYTSAATSATHSYGTGTCAATPVWGINDGIVNAAYIYTSTGSSTTTGSPVTISLTSISANDVSGSIPTCIESVYNNGTLSIGTTTVTFVPSANSFGPFLLRYIPTNTTTGVQGNITYVFGYTYPGACSPVSVCDIVQNGGFESNGNCGQMSAGVSSVTANCWTAFTRNPDLFVRNCTSALPLPANLGTNTYSSSIGGTLTPFNSHAPITGNDAVIGIGAAMDNTGVYISESIANFLGSPLVNNQTYQLSFWAYQFSGDKGDPLPNNNSTYQSFNANQIPAVLNFATSNQFIAAPLVTFPVTFPVPFLVNTALTATLSNTFNTWKYYSIPFTYTNSSNGNLLYIGTDNVGTTLNYLGALGQLSNNLFYTLLDDISIKPIGQVVSFNLPNTQICASQGFTNLGQYTSLPGGTFTASAGISTVTGSNGIEYNFNVPATLPNGLYTIVYTYTDALSCTQKVYQQVSIGNSLNNVITSYTPASTCILNGTLAVVSPSSGLSYTWQPGNISATTTAVSPSVNTVYTVSAASNSVCNITGTILVQPNIPTPTIAPSTNVNCWGSTLTAVGNFTTINWLPGNLNTNPVIVTPSATTVYTAIVTNSLGCSGSQTMSLAAVPASTVSISAVSSTPCVGGQSTLTAFNTYTPYIPSIIWSPGNYTSTSIVVNPSVSTIYTLTLTNPQGCIATQTTLVYVSSPLLSFSSNSLCPHSVITVSASGNYTSIIWQPGTVTANTYTTMPPQGTTVIYTVTASYSNGCASSQTFQLKTADFIPQYTINSVNPVICAGNSETLTIAGSPNFTAVNWSPGNFTVYPAIISPTASTIYTAAITTNSFGCIYNYTFQANVSNSCCTGSYTQIAKMTSTNQTISGTGNALNGDLIIPSGSTLTLNGEFVFAPNVKITVSPSAKLIVNNSHLYACNSTMWQGIEILDGGYVKFYANNYDNLIEDAITALDANNNSTSNLSSIIDASNTTFNKNYIDINIGSYSKTVTTYPFKVERCVFTCRSLSTTATAWPQTGITSAATNTAADLRYVSFNTFSTTVLASPYLNQGFQIVKLKSPYADHTSQIAIQINSVGVNSGTIMYGAQIGSTVNTSDFNLFDSHVQFIVADNSNLTCLNNVFQNTQSYSYTYTIPGGPPLYINMQGFNFVAGNAAIVHGTSGPMNTKLDLAVSNVTVGNRFWNCHIGIQGLNTYRFDIQNAMFRSIQSSTLLPSTFYTPVGGTGIGMNTNRFDYYISTNEFININNSINIPIAPGSFTSGLTGTATAYGIYADRIRIVNNNFTPGLATNNYMNNAVTITGPNNTPWDVAPDNSTPFTRAVVVSNNTLSNVFRGIWVNGITGYQTAIENNTITLKNDGVFTISQYGIKLTDTNPTSNASIGKNIIASNTVSFTPSTSTTNVLGSLIYCGNNGYGICSPSVTCNKLTKGYQAFVFESANNGAIWAANTMSVPMSRGLVLDNAGVIGTQGSNAFASANIWSGTWTTSPASTLISGTYIGTNSSATNSPLWVKNNSGTITTNPPANFGSVLNTQWYGAVGSYSISTGGDHTCSRDANNRNWSVPNSNNFVSADQFYMSKLALYRFLHFNDSLINADVDLEDFYNEQSTGTIGTLTTIEEKLYVGDLTTANTLLAALDPSNTIEDNYKTYFTLYLHFANNNFDHTNATDSTNLASMALLCPGENGACVYQARALYNSVYNRIINDSECESSGARMAPSNKTQISAITWNVELFPNPAANQITILSNIETEKIKIIIIDLSGRIVSKNELTDFHFFVNLELGLENGSYIVTLVNDKDEMVSKKLIIFK